MFLPTQSRTSAIYLPSMPLLVHLPIPILLQLSLLISIVLECIIIHNVFTRALITSSDDARSYVVTPNLLPCQFVYIVFLVLDLSILIYLYYIYLY